MDEEISSITRRTRFAEPLDDITPVNGETMIINCCYELKHRILGRNITGTFFVLPDLTQDLILGIDLIRKFGLNFQAKAGLVTVKRGSIGNNGIRA